MTRKPPLERDPSGLAHLPYDQSAYVEMASQMWGPFLNSIQSWQTENAAKVAALGEDWFNFLGQRLQKDLALPRRLAECRAPDEVWRVYAEFLRSMTTDYQEEAQRLLAIGGRGIGPHARLGREQQEQRSTKNPPERSTSV